MRIFGVCLVRNEREILPFSLAHHLNLGFQRILVGDNGSTDGTRELLDGWAQSGPVQRVPFPGGFHEGEFRTELARMAAAKGAEWVFCFDADEFWEFPCPLSNWAPPAGVDALSVSVQLYVQARRYRVWAPEILLDMTRVASNPLPRTDHTRQLVEAGKISALVREPEIKVAFHASQKVSVSKGFHSVSGLEGRTEKTNRLRILHAPYYAMSRIAAKVDSGRRAAEETPGQPEVNWHLKRLVRLAKEGRLEDEWRACSYENETLDVYGTPHPVRKDLALRNLVAPLMEAVSSSNP